MRGLKSNNEKKRIRCFAICLCERNIIGYSAVNGQKNGRQTHVSLTQLNQVMSNKHLNFYTLVFENTVYRRLNQCEPRLMEIAC